MRVVIRGVPNLFAKGLTFDCVSLVVVSDLLAIGVFAILLTVALRMRGSPKATAG